MYFHGSRTVKSGKHDILSSPSPERHHALDLVRGLAALSVSQYHFMTWNGVATIGSMGTFAVYVFFVLSGLTMMMVYKDKFVDGITPPAIRAFFRKRCARLLPLLMAVAVVSCVRQALTGNANIPAAILTGSGLMALQMPGFLSNSVGAWSLGIEFGFYAVFPIIVVLAGSWRTVAMATVILLVAQHLLLWEIRHAEPFWDYYVSHLIFAPFFALGILIAFDRGVRKIAWLPVALIGLAAVLGYSLVVAADLMRDQLSYLVLTIACGCVIWAAWRSALPAWLVPVGKFLGDISYSMYLTHWIFNDILRVMNLPVGLHWGLFLLFTLVGSYLCYRLFEAPMRSRFGRGPRASSVPGLAGKP